MADALALILLKINGEIENNTLSTLFEHFRMYLNNNLGLASAFNVKIRLGLF